MSTKRDAPLDDNLKEPQLRAFQYWLVDGVYEFFVGFIFLMTAIVYYIQISTRASLLGKFLGIASVIFVCGGAFGGRWVIQRIKERITYPRTGYVTYKHIKPSRGDVVIVIGVFTLILAFVLFSMMPGNKLTPLGPVVGGVIMGILMIQAGHRMGQPRFYLLAFFGFLVGIGLVFSGIRIELGLILFFGLNGLILLISGGLTFWKYLRSYPYPEGHDEP